MFAQRDEGSPPECPSPRPRAQSAPRSPSHSSLTNLTSIQPDKIQFKFYATVDLIRQEHMDAAKASVRDPEILQELEAEIEQDCEWLRGFLFAAKVCDEL